MSFTLLLDKDNLSYSEDVEIEIKQEVKQKTFMPLV